MLQQVKKKFKTGVGEFLIDDYVAGEKDGSNKQDSSKTRSDLSALIFEQLTLPIRDGQTSSVEQGAAGQSESPNAADPAVEINVINRKCFLNFVNRMIVL